MFLCFLWETAHSLDFTVRFEVTDFDFCAIKWLLRSVDFFGAQCAGFLWILTIFLIQYLCTHGQEWGKCTGGRQGILDHCGHGLDLPGTPWVGHRKGHKIGQTSMEVVWPKVQDPIILNNSGGHHCLHLADDAVHWIPRQLGLERWEQVTPSVQGGGLVPPSQPFTVSGVNGLL